MEMNELITLLKENRFEQEKMEGLLEKLSDNDKGQLIDCLVDYCLNTKEESNYELYEVLLYLPDNRLKGIIKQGILHENKLIRTTAIEIIEQNEFIEFLPDLFLLLDDEDEMVRYTAASSIGELIDSMKYTLRESYKKEKSEYSKIGYYFGLYLNAFERDETMYEELKFRLESDNYRVVYRVINELAYIAEYVDQSKKDEVIHLLEEYSEKDLLVGVREVLDKNLFNLRGD